MRYHWTILILLTLILCISCVTTKQEPILVDTSEMSDDLMRASQEGNTAEVRAFLDAGTEVNATDDDGFTALMWASAAGTLEVIRLLIEEGANVNAQSNDGETVLVVALQEGHTEIVELLKKAGAKE